MKEVEALHTAARRYAAERAAAWENRYSTLRSDEVQAQRREGLPEPTTYGYSSEALATFPRYQVLHAIQAAVGAFTPADLGSLDEARELLAKAGAEAQSIFTRPPVGEVEQRAMDEERELFAQYVRGLSVEELARVEPLLFRRTLTEAESACLWAELKSRWAVEGYWYPLDRAPDAEPPPHAQAFNADPFFYADLQQQLRDALAELGVSRVWELRELDTDTDREIDLALLEPVYTGAEGYWTDASRVTREFGDGCRPEAAPFVPTAMAGLAAASLCRRVLTPSTPTAGVALCEAATMVRSDYEVALASPAQTKDDGTA